MRKERVYLKNLKKFSTDKMLNLKKNLKKNIKLNEIKNEYILYISNLWCHIELINDSGWHATKMECMLLRNGQDTEN